MTSYKPDQGRMVRMAAFWSCALLALFGCTSLHTLLGAQVERLRVPIGGSVVPIIGVDLSGALLISTAVFVGVFYVLHRWLQKPKYADLLIETEAELKKVTWPTLEQVVNSSFVVIVFVLILMVYLAGTDWFLGRVFTRLLLGGS